MVGLLFVFSECMHVSSHCTGVSQVHVDSYDALELMHTRALHTFHPPVHPTYASSMLDGVSKVGGGTGCDCSSS